MNTVELFCGTKSFSKVMRSHKHKTWTCDNEPKFDPDERANVLNLFDDLNGLMPWDGKIDMLWASPPCQGFSVAVIGRNWNHDGTPKTDSARLAMKLVRKTLRIVKGTKPKYWFIENPRGMLRKMAWMEEFLKEQGGGPARNKLLPIWGREDEADGHLDKRAMVETSQDLQERYAMPYSRPSRRAYRNARIKRSSRAWPYPAGAFRRNIGADAVI